MRATPTSRTVLNWPRSHNFLWLLVIIALVRLLQKAEWLKGAEHWSVSGDSLGDAFGLKRAPTPDSGMFHDTVRRTAHDWDGNFVVQVLE